MSDIKNLTKEEAECFDRHYVRCEFDDECDVCGKPEGGSYAVGYCDFNGEVDSYICGKCAIKEIPMQLERERKEIQFWDRYFDEVTI